uniref:Uncharacterized protein n=1 Tax=Pyricularia oryzae (strain P131) TaxID=1143193 RepID=L7J460_PYRO1
MQREVFGYQRIVYLAGSTTGSGTADWREALVGSLAHLPVTWVDPSRPEWDESWREDYDHEPFREHVKWELDMKRRADLVVVHLAASSRPSDGLLELGEMAGARRRCKVVCENGYQKRGDVVMLCQRHEIAVFGSVGELARDLAERDLKGRRSGKGSDLHHARRGQRSTLLGVYRDIRAISFAGAQVEEMRMMWILNRLDFFIFLVGGLVLNSNFSKCLLIWFADCRATSHDIIPTSRDGKLELKTGRPKLAGFDWPMESENRVQPPAPTKRPLRAATHSNQPTNTPTVRHSSKSWMYFLNTPPRLVVTCMF